MNFAAKFFIFVTNHESGLKNNRFEGQVALRLLRPASIINLANDENSY
jgi:hypothetical protein